MKICKTDKRHCGIQMVGRKGGRSQQFKINYKKKFKHDNEKNKHGEDYQGGVFLNALPQSDA